MYTQQNRIKILGVCLFLSSVVQANWTFVDSLTDARLGFCGAMLTDGRVMVIGGFRYSAGPNPLVASYEIFDPATGSWTYNSFPYPQTQHETAILLPNGKVLYIRGYGESMLYNPFTEDWETGPIFEYWNDSQGRHCVTLLRDGRVLATVFDTLNPRRYAMYDYSMNTARIVGNTIYNHWFAPIEVLLPNGHVLLAGGSFGGTNCEVFNPTDNSWTPVDGMDIPRHLFVGIRLHPPWNQILVAADRQATSATELYTYGGTWTNTSGELNFDYPRETPAMVMLPNGKPILMGGGGGFVIPITNECEIYDPNSGTWSPTTPMNRPRGHFNATILYTGKVIAIGGYLDRAAEPDLANASAEIYDPAVGIWTTMPSIPENKKGHTATLLPIIPTNNCSTNVIIVGGENEDGYSSACVLYNYSLESVMLTGSLGTARAYHTATLLPTGKVLVVGGTNGNALTSCEIYDVNTESWSPADSMSNPRFNHTATLMSDGSVLVTGGENDVGVINSCERYVYGTNSWTSIPNMNEFRVHHTAVMLRDGRIMVIGGEDVYGMPLNSCEIWDGSSWTRVNSMSEARAQHTAVLLQSGKVLVIGGRGTSGPLTSCEIYDPATGEWSFEANLNTARYLHTSTLMYSGLVVVIGGYNGTNYLSSCEVYDPATHEWTVSTSASIPRAFHNACIIPDVQPYILAIGGYNGNFLNSVEEYDIGLGYQRNWQSIITNYPSVTHISNPMNIEGELFRGVSEADGGNHCHVMSSDHPIISLLRVGGGNWQGNGGDALLYMPLSSSWSDVHTTVEPEITNIKGYYALWSIVNGIPCKWYEECASEEETETKDTSCEAQVYPNPSRGNIFLKLVNITGDITIDIYDCSGRLVSSKKQIASNKEQEIVKIDRLKPGIYFYRIKSNNFMYKGKFTVLR